MVLIRTALIIQNQMRYTTDYLDGFLTTEHRENISSRTGISISASQEGKDLKTTVLILPVFFICFQLKKNLFCMVSSKTFLKFVEKYKTERWLTRSLEEKELLSKGIQYLSSQ